MINPIIEEYLKTVVKKAIERAEGILIGDNPPETKFQILKRNIITQKNGIIEIAYSTEIAMIDDHFPDQENSMLIGIIDILRKDKEQTISHIAVNMIITMDQQKLKIISEKEH